MTTLREQWKEDQDLFISDDDDGTPWTLDATYIPKTGSSKAVRIIADLAIDEIQNTVTGAAITIEILSTGATGVAAPVGGDKITIAGVTFRIEQVTTDPDGFHILSAIR